MNKVTLIGNLSHSPELKTTASGISVCKFSIAVNRNYTSADGERGVDFFNVVVWRSLAENCAKYLAKGKKCAISGRVENRSYDGNDGVKKYITEIIADDVEFLSPQGDSRDVHTASEDKSKRTHPELKPIESEDLPF